MCVCVCVCVCGVSVCIVSMCVVTHITESPFVMRFIHIFPQPFVSGLSSRNMGNCGPLSSQVNVLFLHSMHIIYMH